MTGRGDEASEQGPDGGGDRGGCPNECVDLLLRRPFEVAVDQRLHGRQQERRPEAPEDRPADDHRRQALREGHRRGTDGVAEQARHVGALAPDEVADLAADQDERGGRQRLEGDCRLHAADGRVEIGRHRRDRTFISDVSKTSTNIAAASKSPSRVTDTSVSSTSVCAAVVTGLHFRSRCSILPTIIRRDGITPPQAVVFYPASRRSPTSPNGRVTRAAERRDRRRSGRPGPTACGETERLALDLRVTRLTVIEGQRCPAKRARLPPMPGLHLGKRSGDSVVIRLAENVP